MNKWVYITIVVCVVIVVYIIMAAAAPAITSVVNTANTTMAASSNLDQMPGIQGATLGFPVYMWFIPGVVGCVAIVWTLKWSGRR